MYIPIHVLPPAVLLANMRVPRGIVFHLLALVLVGKAHLARAKVTKAHHLCHLISFRILTGRRGILSTWTGLTRILTGARTGLAPVVPVEARIPTTIRISRPGFIPRARVPTRPMIIFCSGLVAIAARAVIPPSVAARPRRVAPRMLLTLPCAIAPRSAARPCIFSPPIPTKLPLLPRRIWLVIVPHTRSARHGV